MHEHRMLHRAVFLPTGNVLVISGSGGCGATCELYDPETENWRYTDSLSEQRESFTATLLLDGRVLVAGGLKWGYQFLRRCEIYDPLTGTWSPTDSMYERRLIHSAVLLPSGEVLVTGGYFGTRVCEIFDPVTEQILGDEMANSMLSKSMRSPWRI